MFTTAWSFPVGASLQIELIVTDKKRRVSVFAETLLFSGGADGI